MFELTDYRYTTSKVTVFEHIVSFISPLLTSQCKVMSSANGSRRVGPIRKSLSDYSAGMPRISSGGALDDKNIKADGNTSRTNAFITTLLVLSLVICSVLGYSHFRKQGQSVELTNDGLQNNHQLRQQAGQSIQTKNMIIPEAQNLGSKMISGKNMQIGTNTVAARNQAVDTPAVKHPLATVNPPLSKPPVVAPTTIKGAQLSKAVEPPKITLKPTKIDWEGCLYELPPSKQPSADTATANTKPDNKKNNKNTAGYDYNRRHIVAPPAGEVTLVCCNTTKGPLNIEVHPTWAPRGAERFLLMVSLDLVLLCIHICEAIDFMSLVDWCVRCGVWKCTRSTFFATHILHLASHIVFCGSVQSVTFPNYLRT